MGNNQNKNNIKNQVITGQDDKKTISKSNTIKNEVFTGQGSRKILTLSDINRLSYNM